MNMNTSAVFNFLKDAVLELKDIEPADITESTELEGIDLQSLDYVDIQVNIRKTYGVAISSEVFSTGTVKTMGELAAYIVAEAGKLQDAKAA